MFLKDLSKPVDQTKFIAIPMAECRDSAIIIKFLENAIKSIQQNKDVTLAIGVDYKNCEYVLQYCAVDISDKTIQERSSELKSK